MDTWIRFRPSLGNFACAIVLYKELKNIGFSSWDRENNLVTTHERIGPIRGILSVAMVIVILLSSAIGVAYERQNKDEVDQVTNDLLGENIYLNDWKIEMLVIAIGMTTFLVKYIILLIIV